MNAPKKKRQARHTIDGVTHTLDEWCEIYGLTRRQISQRMRRNRELKDALTCKVQLAHGPRQTWRQPANPVLNAFLRHPAPPPPP